MCGIAGFTLPEGSGDDQRRDAKRRLRRMVVSLHHRGPDALEGMLLPGIALGHSRLSILDLEGGAQPMRDEQSGLTIVFNGEIFNHAELRRRLESTYRFRTRSDTEVILASFLAEGIGCVERFNGQFAFAIHDPRDGSLWLGRDRFGKRPLFYSHDAGMGFAFASEVKALFASGLVEPRLDSRAILETLHFWAPTQERTPFEGVQALPPGSVAKLRLGALEIRSYWDLDLGEERIDRRLTAEEAAEELEALLGDAVRLRLQADVPVAAYLSGGLDSSLLCALAQRQLGGGLQTFSVSFAQARYDEGSFQERVAAALGTQHHRVEVEDGEIGALLPRVVEHAEVPLLRTAPAPLLKLSGLVRSHGTKVVLTGEGADELFLGYDLFKEVQIRRFWSRQPGSTARPMLFARLYPFLPASRHSPQMMRQFFGQGLDQVEALDASHRIRWTSSGRIARFLSAGFLETLHGWDPIAELHAKLPAKMQAWHPLARAQYLEIRTFLSPYLLSSQGDRMLMANSVEGRFPFLDHRVAEFAARLPPQLKLQGLKEKLILRHLAKDRVPPEVLARTKFPYRAPIAEALVGGSRPEWSRALLTGREVDEVGIFDGAKVERLVAKLSSSSAAASEADEMALAAIATTQLLARRFAKGWGGDPERVEVGIA